MSAFLRHLVARTRPARSAIQPRVLSRFELPSSWPAKTFVEEHRELENQPTSAPQPREAPNASDDHRPSLSVRESPIPSLPFTATTALTPPTLPSTRSEIIPPAVVAAQSSMIVTNIAAPRADPPQAPTSIPGTPPAQPVPTVASSTHLLPIVNTLLVERLIESPPTTRSAPAKTSPSAVAPPANVREFPSSQTPVASLAPPAQPPPTIPSSAPTSVHVTIGRIEVRAVPAPALPPARPASSRVAPTLSLEDYLKQRSAS